MAPIYRKEHGKIWFVSCPICRRRYFTTYLLRRFRSDFRPIEYPISFGHSLGRYGTTIDQRIAWSKIVEIPSEVFEAASIFVKRLLNTYAIVTMLFSERPYAESYRTEPFSGYAQFYDSTRSLQDIVEPYREPNYSEVYLNPLI